ncbi:MAG: hypothetical protein J0I06_09360 [Planctomycetes bacterium]|nr:hypothetical protein [Planctomycetota bacterium]
MLDIQSAATELWAKQPKELVPWLGELLIAAKEHERFTHVRVLNGSAAPSELTAASRLRLKIEAELWKAKHAE